MNQHFFLGFRIPLACTNMVDGQGLKRRFPHTSAEIAQPMTLQMMSSAVAGPRMAEYAELCVMVRAPRQNIDMALDDFVQHVCAPSNWNDKGVAEFHGDRGAIPSQGDDKRGAFVSHVLTQGLGTSLWVGEMV